MNRSGHRETVLDLVVRHRVAAHHHGAGGAHHIFPAPQDLGEHPQRELPLGERRECQRRERHAAHREDIRQRVRRGDAPEVVRIVYDGGKEIHRLHEREIIAHTKDRGVIERVRSDEQPRIDVSRERRERCG